MRRSLPLAPRSVADFYREVMTALDDVGLGVRIWSMPVEVESPIRFEQDHGHRSYDREYVERWWRILVRVQQVLNDRRCHFIGKCSPVHFFWGAFDVAVTRFSGRPAPPREGPAFMREAYSHEVISHGFWPGNAALGPAFYAYAVPEPDGLKTAAIEPEGAYYHAELGEFILPYDVVRTASSPEARDRGVRRQHLPPGGDVGRLGSRRAGAHGGGDTRVTVEGMERSNFSPTGSAGTVQLKLDRSNPPAPLGPLSRSCRRSARTGESR